MKKEYEEKFKTLKFPLDTLKNICFDKEHRDEYLTDSMIGAIDFDKLAIQYCEKSEIEKRPCTNDALYLSGEEWFFIEFKNGQIVDGFSDEHTTVEQIGQKIVSSLAVLFSITNENEEFKKCFPFYKGEMSYTSKHFNYILVYNPDKNVKIINSDRRGWEKRINTGSFDKEIMYFAEHYQDLLSSSDAKKQERKIRLNKEDAQKQKKTPEYLMAKEYFKERTKGRFCDFVKDIRTKMSGKKNVDSEFDIIGEIVLEETEPSYQEGQLPLLVRFGLDKYAGSWYKNVFTYAGACKQKDGTYNYEESEFYLEFVSRYENES